MSELSRLGLGITGPHATQLVSRADTVRLVRAAIGIGVTTFDTGPMYGDGEAERRLGLALKGVPRDRVFVVTKARTWTHDGDAPTLSASLRGSLARLGLDHVDALLLHGPTHADIANAAGELGALRDQGLARRFGVCGRGTERDAMIATRAHSPLFDILMTPAAGDVALLQAAADAGVDVMAIETMRARRRFRTPRSLADLWYLARDCRDALTQTPPPADVGLAGALSLPGVKCAVVTTTRPAHLYDNARSAGLATTRPKD